MDEVIKKLNEYDKRFDRLTKAVVDNQEQLERVEQNMATKKDTNEIINTLDDLVGLAKKKDEELVFMGEHVDRIEKDVEKIKTLVGQEGD